jgi:hypothetical protein
MATICGISVIATERPLNHAADAPTTRAATARPRLTQRCGLAAASTVKTLRKLASTATSMP